MCKDYCCAEFSRYSDMSDRKKVYDLDNEIHPLFLPLLDQLSDDDAKRATPALRLASKAILTDAAVKYMLTIFEGDMHLDNEHGKVIKKGRKTTWSEVSRLDAEHADTAGLNSTQILRFPQASWPRKVYEEMRSKARMLLISMVDMIEIVVEAIQDEGNGVTDVEEGPLPAETFLTFPRGCRTKITVSNDTIEDLNIENRPLFESLALADVLLHEFAHALQYAVNGERLEECFYRNAKYSEAGYDFVNEIFGGVFEDATIPGLWCPRDPAGRQKFFDKNYDEGEVLREEDNYSSKLVLMEWPNEYLLDVYDRNEFKMTSRIGRGSGGDGVIRVPISAVEDWFTTAFWQRDSSKYSARAVTARTMPWWVMQTPEEMLSVYDEEAMEKHSKRLGRAAAFEFAAPREDIARILRDSKALRA